MIANASPAVAGLGEGRGALRMHKGLCGRTGLVPFTTSLRGSRWPAAPTLPTGSEAL
jgi:hypothetical protein